MDEEYTSPAILAADRLKENVIRLINAYKKESLANSEIVPILESINDSILSIIPKKEVEASPSASMEFDEHTHTTDEEIL